MNFQYDQHYESLTAFAEVRPSNVNAAEYAETQGSLGGAEWFGVASSKEVRTTVATGWPEGVERTFAALRALEVRPARSIRRRRVRADFGDSIDMQRVYRGDLANAWERTRKADSPASPIVRVYVDVGAKTKVQPAQLFWRGAAALVVIDALQTAGYAVEVIAGMTGHIIDTTMRQTVTVKESGAPLDLNALAACLCLIGFHRVFGFAARFSVPKHTSSAGTSFAWEMPGAISGLTYVYSKDDAQEWINSTLAPFAG